MAKIFKFFVIISMLTSCVKNIGGQKSNVKEEKIESYNEDLTMFLPSYEVKRITNTPSVQPQIVEAPIIIKNKTVKSDTEKVEEILAKISYSNSQISEAMGYRIQLFSGNNKTDFEAAKNYIFRNHSELGLYESYSQPTYKIKVGDFLSKSAADKYYQTLKPNFGAIRIITEKIDIKKAREIK